MLELDLPVGSQWKIKLDVTEALEMRILGSVQTRRLVLEGNFTMKKLPPAKTYAEFFKANPAPEIDFTSDAMERLIQWRRNIYEVAYSGIEGEAEGFFFHSDSGGYWNLGNEAAGVHEELPEMKYPISSIIRGGFWLDGIALWFGRNVDIFTSPWENNETGWCFERVKKGKGQSKFTNVIELNTSVKVGLDSWEWPSESTNMQLIQYSNAPQHFSSSKYKELKIDAEILLASNCPFSAGRYTVTTNRITPAWTPNNSLNSQAIDRLRGGSPIAGKMHLGRTLGDIPKPSLGFDWDECQSNYDVNQHCLWVDNIEVNQPTTIELYIASEISPGSCPYNAVLAHEQKLANTITDDVDKYLATLKERILSEPNIPSKSHPLCVAKVNVDDEQKRVQDLVRDILRDCYNTCLKQTDTDLQVLESPAAHAKVHASCPEADWP